MIKIMKKYDYKVMDEFMNNMTNEDYNSMIKIMRESGYDYMADMMELVDREEMIKMHNVMGGAGSCHVTKFYNSGMMTNY